MKALRVHRLGSTPVVDDIGAPDAGPGQSVVRMLASPLNPIDRAVAAGTFYGGHPPLPYVVGAEVIGVVESSASWPVNSRVWALGGGLGTKRDGSIAEWVVIDDDQAEPIPAGLDSRVAAALGIAGLTGWLAIRYRARTKPGDRVLVLGASGAVGLAAVQAARIAGAESIVAVGRSEEGLRRARQFGATACVALSAQNDRPDPAWLTEHLKELTNGGADVVVDPLWGEVCAAALQSAAADARIVQLGQSGGATSTVASATIRGKQLNLLGFSIFSTPPEVRQSEFAAMSRAALLGQITMPYNAVGIDDSSLAWAAANSGARRLVVCTAENDQFISKDNDGKP